MCYNVTYCSVAVKEKQIKHKVSTTSVVCRIKRHIHEQETRTISYSTGHRRFEQKVLSTSGGQWSVNVVDSDRGHLNVRQFIDR